MTEVTCVETAWAAILVACVVLAGRSLGLCRESADTTTYADHGILVDKLQNSHVTGVLKTFLHAYSSRSKPFFPGHMALPRRSNSTTLMLVSNFSSYHP